VRQKLLSQLELVNFTKIIMFWSNQEFPPRPFSLHVAAFFFHETTMDAEYEQALRLSAQEHSADEERRLLEQVELERAIEESKFLASITAAAYVYVCLDICVLLVVSSTLNESCSASGEDSHNNLKRKRANDSDSDLDRAEAPNAKKQHLPGSGSDSGSGSGSTSKSSASVVAPPPLLSAHSKVLAGMSQQQMAVLAEVDTDVQILSVRRKPKPIQHTALASTSVSSSTSSSAAERFPFVRRSPVPGDASSSPVMDMAAASASYASVRSHPENKPRVRSPPENKRGQHNDNGNGKDEKKEAKKVGFCFSSLSTANKKQVQSTLVLSKMKILLAIPL
jgi:hypothetical protein